ncbi:LacI family DNA-binding transcriptional regulator [Frondihabitans cladoniiphilus]|uniref:LacI family DNA-binding transcriptional regulator n=1 Tax=Frondihabitans cladoniiphilus TaxID=715785 RepID=A0ABP8W3J1_9MICO
MRDSAGPTIYDVAERAGVSKSLVSLVLRGGVGVSEKRRLAVQAAIDELGYRPSLAASALAGNRTHGIGVLIDDYTNLWFVNLIRGMDDELFGQRFSLTVADTQLNAHLGRSPVEAFLGMRVEGLVIAAEPTPDVIDALTGPGAARIPTVVAGGRAGVIPGADVVAIDEELGSRLAVEHLVSLGHTAIAHVTGLGGSAANRLRGYERAMGDARLTPIVVGHGLETTEEAGFAATREVLAGHPTVSAVFTANDTMAVGALGALRDEGLSVPGDVSVVGYDNSPLAGAHLVDITTVDDRGASLGTEVVRALLSRIADPSLPARTTLVPPTLVVRSSTGPAPR